MFIIAETLSQDNYAIDSSTNKRLRISSDPEIQDILEDYEKIYENECSNDYDIVWEDIPVNTNENAFGPYCSTENKFQCDNNECFTNCWPRDWLAQDCNQLRVIGVNYETNLSLWTPICPIEKVKNLAERSDELIEQLLKVNVGKRPIVWVTHSMGGLLVKSLLNKGRKNMLLLYFIIKILSI